MATTIAELEARVGKTFFDYQLEAYADIMAQQGPARRLCLYYRTGAGKTLTALVCVALAGWNEALVIAPPVTHRAWQEAAAQVGLTVETISHAKFRQKTYRVRRDVAVIADEFHLFGGHDSKGYPKFAKMAQHLQAPCLLLSATPNYNDAERCYCIQFVLDPLSCRGGYLQWIYTHCMTQQNPFGMTPIVTGFLHHKDASAFLASLPHVHYLPDQHSVHITDIRLHVDLPDEFELYGLSRRKQRIMASQMEARHTRIYDQLVDGEEMREPARTALTDLIDAADGQVLVFCASAKIAEVVLDTLCLEGYEAEYVTGEHQPKVKQAIIDNFRHGGCRVLVGTATLATGTDGLDKVCDTLVIVNDTDDDALRKQLIGRILPRGADADASRKKVFRLVLDS